ncbi:MAG: ribbon-helix-helix domain-containing protein [Candidatus Rokuibacteriota bacterium]
MRMAKIAITIPPNLLTHIDRWVREGRYASRSHAIEAAVVEKLERARRLRLADELEKADQAEERALAEDGFAAGNETWPAC